MDSNRVFISLGSNLGNREEALANAAEKLQPEVSVIASSNIYQTEPWGFTDQPAFLNQVVEAVTALTPIALLDKLKGIEQEIGREPNFRYGPRIIDLDILFYNDTILDTEVLSIPHKELCSRAFVLIPLLDIAPDYIHPVMGKTILELASIIGESDVAIFMENL